MKERLTGATVLILLVVILSPLVLDDAREVETRITASNIPEKPEEEFTTRLVPLPEQDEVVPAEEVELADVDPGPVEADTAPAAGGGAAPVEADSAGAAETETADAPGQDTGAAGAGAKTAGLTGWVVQAGSFSRKNADTLNARLRAAGYPSYVVDEPVEAGDGSLLYRVRIGPEVLRSEALKLKAEIKKEMGLDGFVLNYP